MPAPMDEPRSPEGPARTLDPRARHAFVLLIAAQAAHSVEECVFRLFDVFAPARFVSGLFSDDPATGFVIGNVLIVLAGVLSYALRVRRPHPSERAFAWFWTCLEFGNGCGHCLFALLAGGYFPGVGTAPLLLAVSSYLATHLLRSSGARGSRFTG